MLCFGLASDGVYMCPPCYQRGGSLLHCLSTLTHSVLYAVYFCCTGLGVTSTGRYPASCPVKPGLSSSAAFRLPQPRLSVLLNACIIIPFFSVKVNHSTTLNLSLCILLVTFYLPAGAGQKVEDRGRQLFYPRISPANVFALS